jgi:rubrerythrin
MRVNVREILKDEIEQLSDEHVEQVLHHVRELRERPEASEGAPGNPWTQLDIGQNGAELVWYCQRCRQQFPRPLEDPSHCPTCSAPRSEMVLQEASERPAA